MGERFYAGLAACILLLGPCAAHAVTAPADATDRLGVRLAGHVTAKCSLSIEGAADRSFGAIMDMHTGRASASTLDLPFALSCNAPYTAELVSKNGGLAFDGGATAGFSSRVDYDASIGLAASAGGLSLACSSANMRGDLNRGAVSTGACSATSRSQDVAAGEGRVKLTLRAGGLPLLKGVYSDQLILRIAPNVSGERG